MASFSTNWCRSCGKYLQIHFLIPNAKVQKLFPPEFQGPTARTVSACGISFFSRRLFRNLAERRFGRQELDLERRPYGHLAFCQVCSLLHPEQDCDMSTSHQYNTCCLYLAIQFLARTTEIMWRCVPTADFSYSATRALSLNDVHMSRDVVEDRSCGQSTVVEMHVTRCMRTATYCWF